MNFLHVTEWILILLTAASLWLHHLPHRRAWAGRTAFTAGVLSTAHFIDALPDPRWEMMPVYTLAVLLSLNTVFRVFAVRRPRISISPVFNIPPLASRTLRGLAAAFGFWLLTFPLLVAPMISSGYSHDFGNLGWTEAFDRMHAEFSAEYPFTDWKAVDWDKLAQVYRPIVLQAEADHDFDTYALALRRYTYSIPDGHVRLSSPDNGLRHKAVGGGFGLALSELDDGRIIVTELWEGSSAAQTGIVWGSEVVSWDGKPVQEALRRTDIVWAARPPASGQNRRLEELRFLTRAPVGTEVNVVFLNPNSGLTHTAVLTAADDAEQSLKTTELYNYDFGDTEAFESRLLNGRFGYIKLRFQRFPSRTPSRIRQAVRQFESDGASGLILDLRSNRGGSNFAVGPAVAPFFASKSLYHHVAEYNSRTRRFESIPFNALDPVIPGITYRVIPQRTSYEGPVAVLIDQSTASSAEGIAMLMARRPHTRLFGFYGTSGILAAGNVKRWRLPGEIEIRMQSGRSLDSEGRIQVDSDAGGNGGVLPAVRIPHTKETLWAAYAEGRDLVLEEAMAWLEEVSQTG